MPDARSCRRSVAALAVLGLAAAGGAAAQGPVPPAPAVAPASAGGASVAGLAACLRALPPSAATRVPVLVYGEVVDTADARARPVVDLAAQAVAERVRAALWGSAAAAERADGDGRLPAADSLMSQGALVGGVRVTLRRDGAVTWRPTTPGTAAPDSAAALLLARAVAAARDAGDLLVPDDLVRGDSLVFDLEHAYPAPSGPGGPLEPVRRRNPAPVFTLPVVWTRQAALQGGLAVRYPAALQRGGFEGTVVLQFVVDTAGRADPATVRDRYPAAGQALAPGLRDAYAQFVAAVRDAVLRARFTPASLGGCPVRQLVEQRASFRLVR